MCNTLDRRTHGFPNLERLNTSELSVRISKIKPKVQPCIREVQRHAKQPVPCLLQRSRSDAPGISPAGHVMAAVPTPVTHSSLAPRFPCSAPFLDVSLCAHGLLDGQCGLVTVAIRCVCAPCDQKRSTQSRLGGDDGLGVHYDAALFRSLSQFSCSFSLGQMSALWPDEHGPQDSDRLVRRGSKVKRAEWSDHLKVHATLIIALYSPRSRTK